MYKQNTNIPSEQLITLQQLLTNFSPLLHSEYTFQFINLRIIRIIKYHSWSQEKNNYMIFRYSWPLINKVFLGKWKLHGKSKCTVNHIFITWVYTKKVQVIAQFFELVMNYNSERWPSLNNKQVQERGLLSWLTYNLLTYVNKNTHILWYLCIHFTPIYRTPVPYLMQTLIYCGHHSSLIYKLLALKLNTSK